MKKQLTNRILSLVLTAVMVLGMMPMSSFTAFAEEIPTEKNIMLGASHIEGAQASNVYFGRYQQSSDGNGDYNFEPIKWRVLSKADGKLFLLSDKTLDASRYHVEDEIVTWETSTIRSWLNGYAASSNIGGDSGIDYTSDNFLDTAFSVKEQNAILDTTVVNNDNPNYGTEGGNNTNDKVFLLSIAEASNTDYFADNDSRKASKTDYMVSRGGDKYNDLVTWWLRSPGVYENSAAVMGFNGIFAPSNCYPVDMICAVRPAFNLNLNSVLFTSAAVDGKPQGFQAVEEYTGNEYKLTLLDGRRNFAVSDTTAKTVKTGDTLSLGYTGATTDANEYISAMIADENDEILYYGMLASVTSNSGTVEFTVPSDIASGTYTLKLLNEQINGDYNTDYASDFVDIALTVETSAPESVTEYPLWVGGVQFTSDNLIVTGGDGTATYDPAGNTLTLNNYTYTGAGYAISETRGAAIYYDDTGKTLNLVLKGTNSVTHSGIATGNTDAFSYGVYANGSITVMGDGSLSATGGTATSKMVSYSYGVRASGSITVTGGNLHGTGGTVTGVTISTSYGVFSDDVITVSGDGSLHGTGGAGTGTVGTSYGVWSNVDITVTGGSLNGTGGTATGDMTSESRGVYTPTGNITVSDGSLSGTGGMGKESQGVFATGSISVTGGSLIGIGGMDSRNSYGVRAGGSITVSDGSLNGTGGEGSSSYGVYASDSMTIFGGEVVAKGNSRAFWDSSITITGTLAVYDESGAVIEAPVWTGTGALIYAKIAAKSAGSEVPANAVASVTRDDAAETVYCTTLGEAINKVKDAQADDNAVVTLLKDIEESAVETAGVFTLELNGKTWQFSGSQRLDISQGAELTIQDSSSDQKGRILADESSEYACLIKCNSNSTLNITGGTFTVNNDNILLIDSDGTLNITGGTFSANGNNTYAVSNGGAMIMEDGDITGVSGIYNFGTAELKGGTVTANFAYALGNEGNATVSGADLITTGENSAIMSYTGSSLTFQSGKIKGESGDITWGGGTITIESSADCDGLIIYSADDFAIINLPEGYHLKAYDISSGMVGDKIDSILSGGWAIVTTCDHSKQTTATNNGNGTHSFTCSDCGDPVTEDHIYTENVAGDLVCICGAKAVAKVGDVTYTDFADALKNWTDGTTLTLLANVEHGSDINLSTGTRTFDGGKYTLTLTGEYEKLYNNSGTLNIVGGTILANGTAAIINNGTLNISGGTVSAPSGTAIVNNGNMTLKNGNINGESGIENNGTATLEDGTVTASTHYALVNYGKAYLSGADLIAKGGNPAIFCTPESETTISGGTLSSKDVNLILREGGKLTITDTVNCDGWTVMSVAGAVVGTDIILPADHYMFDGDKLVTELLGEYTIQFHKHTYSYIADGNTHYGKCGCGTVTAHKDHTLTYSANEDTNTVTAVCDICRGNCGSATLKVPEFAYYTNSSVFSAGYGSSFENGEEVKLTYDDGDTGAPSTLGKHTATLTVYEGGEVKASVSAEYEITYLPSPQNAYNISGGYSAEDTRWFKEGETVTVTAPSGYKISKELNGNYGDLVSFSEGDDMVIYLKDENGAMTDAINVTGVIFDKNTPTGKITVSERNFWEQLINKVTFGLFFKGDMVATVTYSDTDSGVASVEYHIASEDLIADPALNNAAAVVKLENAIGGNWKTYSAEIALNRNDENVIYVKITDNVGNVTYISSEGIVLDSIAPELHGIENGGVYYGDKVFKATDENFLKIELDGVNITETTEGDDEFKILADNLKHIVTVTDRAGNVTEYTITVYKRYSVTFTDGEGGSYEKEFKYGEVITIPTNEFFEDTFRKTGYTPTEWQGYTEGMTMPLNNLTFTAVYTPNNYTVEFDTNGGEAVSPITVTFDAKYGRLPSSSVAGFSGGDKNWYLVDANGNVTETNIKNLTLVSIARDHKLFIKRNVLSPDVSIVLTVPGGISDGYQYYIPGASQRVLTATVNNANTELLSYTYQWYKDGAPIEGATASVLTLDGNVADSGAYKVEVTATLKDGTGIVVTTSSATGSKEQNVKILHTANTLSYDANGGEGGPQSSYTGGTSLNVSKDEPTREHYDFIGWNTKADGNGESYKANDVYTFTSDGGNGGCTATLYAQWKLKKYTVTYIADGQTVSSEKVEYGKDATLPTVPHKDGYVGKWDDDGKNITADTTISVVYTKIPVVEPDEVKPDDKTDLEDTKKQLEELLKDDSYTEEAKKDIQDAIDDIDEALKVIGNVENVEKLIDKLPDTIKKEDEAAIKAADDAYNELSDYEKSLVDNDAKKALDDAKAALAELKKPTDSNIPATGDNSNMFLWIALLFISGGTVIALTFYDRKRRMSANK